MDLNKTPSANRLHIAIFGKRNMGKSSLINAITNQDLAIVSDFAGTTTDPVYKSMEILPIGPVVLIDTAGIDDEGELGELRIKKSLDVIKKTDIALILVDETGLNDFDIKILDLLSKSKIPFIIVINKIDAIISKDNIRKLTIQFENLGYNHIQVSAKENINIRELKDMIIKYSPKEFEEPSILGDLVQNGEHVVLVIPIDTGMPKGRLILPQVQIMRDLLDNDVNFHVCKERELRMMLESLKEKPKLVITDSQVFSKVSADTPDDILLTSFSILFARYKGDLLSMVEGALALKTLQAGDKVLIAESCTHHQQPDDIGKVKIPRWIRQNISEDIIFEFSNGRNYPDNLKDYKVVIHCGGCMLNRKEMLYRIESSVEQGVPIINYGLTIAYLNGILDRALKVFPEVYEIWDTKNSI
ncbi:MAG: [FeFe] hydrogenase H-cluster maturation GTPase HydF [Leptotrichiaceae bacterium]|nr:[FeFe] hydrogenase H-cluster maturation GTPase HydF [Leptotrichiaceae bacterium]MBP6168205.1 [FeFe] hydrogenase H-cluster maturation GTPase HydF [Leptotrichiaceae bacterium]MBP7026711.1 [FeFe] hydrogenase H-cluster maturation GTPase HydF [Leptotrichiaceae bacterium]